MGKLYSLFNIKLFSKNKFFVSKKEKFSKFKILLKNKILKSYKKIIRNNINNKIKIGVKIFKLIENLNTSFEAIEVIYINKINIPPKKIKNKEYENQKDLVKSPENKEIKIVCVINKIPIESGWFINVNKKAEIINRKIIRFCIILTENSLFKILILGINEELLLFFSENI